MTDSRLVIPGTGASLIAIKSGSYAFLQYLGGTSTSAKGVGDMGLTPFTIGKPTRIVRLGMEVTAAGDVGATGLIAIYNDDGSGGYPGVPIFDASVAGSASTVLGNGLIDLHTATPQEITCNLLLQPGTYWAGAAHQNAAHDATAFTVSPTIRVIPAQSYSLGVGASLPAANAVVNNVGFRLLNVIAALPSPFNGAVATPGAAGARIVAKAA